MMMRPPVCLMALLMALSMAVQSAEPDWQRGEYLVRIGGCVGCHSDADGVLAGGAAIETPYGKFYPPNITPESQTGIGGWSDDDFLRAMQHGIAPDGRRYFPVFPYPSYSRMRADDVLAIKRYLDRLPAIRRTNLSHELRGLARLDFLLPFWQWLNVDPEWSAVRNEAAAEVKAGAYLVEAVAHCGECHTARDWLGATRQRVWLQGAQLPSCHRASNLTPHADGIAAWEPDELAAYLHSGRSDFGLKARHEMREFVEQASRFLTESDRAAIAQYLFALPARADRAPCAPRGPRLQHCTMR